MTHARLPETKLGPPALPNDLVGRARLHAALSAAVAGPLTLVSAPPGAGKTVMVASWVGSGAAPGPVAWASLGEGDADRHRFWRLVAAALGLGVAVPRRGDLSATLDALCQALSDREEPVVLILDDFHEVDGCEVVADIDRLLAQAPPALRLVLVTRQDPPLRLSRLRLTDGLSEVRQRHLAFTEHEAAELIKHAGATLDANELSMLCRRTATTRSPRRTSPPSRRPTGRSPTTSSKSCSTASPPTCGPSCCGRRSWMPSPATWPTRSPKAAMAQHGWRTWCGATRW